MTNSIFASSGLSGSVILNVRHFSVMMLCLLNVIRTETCPFVPSICRMTVCSPVSPSSSVKFTVKVSPLRSFFRTVRLVP